MHLVIYIDVKYMVTIRDGVGLIEVKCGMQHVSIEEMFMEVDLS